MKDQAGHTVREGLVPVFDKARRIRAWKSKLCGFMSGLPNIDKYHPVEIDVDLQEVYSVLSKVIERVDDHLPHVICARCQGHDQQCACLGRGWLTKSQMMNCRSKKHQKQHTLEADTLQTEQFEE